MKAYLALSDGKVFEGDHFGAEGEVDAEIVFNTSMSGYQEVITDPSYCGQMVLMTYPLIGNYGINPQDFESDRPHLSGFIIKELSGISSNWRSRGTLEDFLKKYGIIGIQGVDTRALTRHIREKGAQQAVLSTMTKDHGELIRKAQNSSGLEGRDLVKNVTCQLPYDWDEGEWEIRNGETNLKSAVDKKYFVVAYDFGVKRNILRMLAGAGCSVRVVPASTPAEEVLALNPDGVFLSNGPGDPEGVPYAIKNIKLLLGKVPIFGICLGHQLLNLALNGKTFKLRFGHHGGNQPVMDIPTGKVEITSQNHGFAVDQNSVGSSINVTSINLNDQTVEGISHKDWPIYSVQYHPEASPGPHDSSHLFHHFTSLMKAGV
ncbi:MAG: glutamine-hydrolyzing carbamoyl-phosphate synthase small subunit [Nitrospina sp.]|jgi:carbamoyl-phosphate synthase small subunit|nr:glutamine-hydrolyzing carbamoyl-phosphate synthase small subunit [Nitrospina sp.]MBT3875877.1 glutamine-hydrolyzing carbamoyl-phosphate synthase small subunit [Nitrospina sp.]MBT4046988.1 glutamine-hydrolyzing carbamoyl-phosphate synthase small subunit [Nitrospina sp.]MBT4557292.1 glutamine-hydrolyzing carbamoyl-phosphate synthase small subunit [Nitrospina sp.]MBT5347564.1 glutamine-hydrolyzing carbamoyl-phosphate synthase small subunit [Nitrospina sp.]